MYEIEALIEVLDEKGDNHERGGLGEDQRDEGEDE
jgi:hypothetical protein